MPTIVVDWAPTIVVDVPLMNKPSRISEAEWLVMRVLWSRGASTTSEVIRDLAPSTGWKPNTVKTLLARLGKKGAVVSERIGREHRHQPVLSETESVQAESRSFLRRVYEGAMMPLIAGFIENEKLSIEEIAELRKLLDAAEKRADQ